MLCCTTHTHMPRIFLMLNLMVCKVTPRLERDTCNMFLLFLATRQTIMASYIYEIMRCLELVAGMKCAGYRSDISQMKLDTLIFSR